MKVFKSTLILSALTFFLIACSQAASNTSSANQNKAANTNQTAVVTNTNAATNQPAATDELAAARKIYAEQCASCHKENGEGGEALYNGEKVKAPSLKGKGAMNATDDRLADYIVNGEEDEMPAFKDKLKPAEIKDLVKFIRKEFQGK